MFLGCSDVDGHIPLARVHETRDVLGRMGAVGDERIYPGMGHTVNADEIAAVRTLLAAQLRDLKNSPPAAPGAGQGEAVPFRVVRRLQPGSRIHQQRPGLSVGAIFTATANSPMSRMAFSFPSMPKYE